MSNKKPRNRNVNPVEMSLPASPAQELQSVQTDKPNKVSLPKYLKKHFWLVAVICFLALGILGAGLKYLDDDARRELARRSSKGSLNKQDESFLNKVNPFLPAALPSPTPQLSKEYIYAGSRMLAVEDANASAALPADLAIWRPSTGGWWILGGSGSQQFSQQWGQAGDLPVPGDYDGDGKTDLAVFRPNATAQTGTWYVFYSGSNTWSSAQFGFDTDKVAPADYDGDSKTDIAVWRSSGGNWYILRSSDGGVSYGSLGASGDLPVPGDYDGDGKADIGVWRNSNTTFYSVNSSNLASQIIAFSQTTTEPVPADYDGDGKADYAIRNGADWIIRHSSSGTIQTPVSWQQAGDKAVPNDYDGDGKVDIATWRDSNGTWYIRQSGSGGSLRQQQWGLSGDIPVPALFRR